MTQEGFIQPKRVYTYSSTGADPIDHYQRVRNERFAEILADLRRQPFGGEYGGQEDAGYFVPHKTLVGSEADLLGITSVGDLFGGVVPHPYQATKSLSHGLLQDGTAVPEGWSQDFADATSGVVLNGYSAFSRTDALKAGQTLLSEGPVRVKKTLTTCGLGQTVVRTPDELAQAIDTLPQTEVEKFGVVLEEDLQGSPITYGIGTAIVGDQQVSYIGRQHKTTNNEGVEEYGGTDLTLVRGGMDALLQLPLDEDVRTAIIYTEQYDKATALIPGFAASRRNYDVINGVNHKGEKRIGVLEPSFRIGGASSPEILALGIFSQNPEASVVEASSYHRFGLHARIPSDAIVFYNETDPEFGPMKIYAIIHNVK